MFKADKDHTTALAAAGNTNRVIPIGRRALLAGAGGAALAGGATEPATAAPDPDAELLAACAAFHAAHARVMAWKVAPGWDDVEGDAAVRNWYDCLERLTPIRPETPAGRWAKARAAYLALQSTEDDPANFQHEEAAALAVLGDLVAGGVA